MIPNEFNRTTTSSVVSFRAKSEVVGDTAKEDIYEYPECTVVSVKRLMGRRFDDEAVQHNLKHWRYELMKGDADMAQIRVKVNNKSRTLMPEEISAKILKKLKELAQKKIGVKVNKAVITVPAYFTDAQKEATINAGKIAGLEVLKIINEPTAAAIAYRLNWGINTSQKNILVYDFGGGTFDVSVLAVSEGQLEVKAVGGDNNLGGDDFDTNLMNYCMDQFKEQHNLTITGDEFDHVLFRLRPLCEKAKIRLSNVEEASIFLRGFYLDKDIDIKITRQTFERINKHLVARSIDITMTTLLEAGFRVAKIDDIVLVGGTTQMPIVERELRKKFNDKELNRSVNPDEAVAVGAAIQAALINKEQSLPLGNLSITDVTPLSLGIEVVGKKFSKVIKKNTKVPCSHTEDYFTSHDNQTLVDIGVFEGESSKVADNNELGRFTLVDIPRGKKGEQKIKVTFTLNDEGLLHVSARVVSTGLEGDIHIEAHKGRLTDDQLEELIRKGV